MNVLLSCVGRRSYMVNYFKEALKDDGRVIVTNSDPVTVGMLAADKAYVVPNVDEKSYIPALLDICVKENINILLSLFDIDLPYLAAAKKQFEEIGVVVFVSSEEVINITNDKWETFNFLNKNNIVTPKTYIDLEKSKNDIKLKVINFPVYIKPRWGMGSLSVFKAENLHELDFYYNLCKKEICRSYLNIPSSNSDYLVLIQEGIDAQEYGMDIFNDLNGEHQVTVIKKKLAMRSGETDAAITVKNEYLRKIGESLSMSLKHIGNLDVDVLYDNKKAYVLELNARFGGGYPFTHASGANLVEAIVNIVKHKNKNIICYSSDILSLKSIVPIVYKDIR